MVRGNFLSVIFPQQVTIRQVKTCARSNNDNLISSTNYQKRVVLDKVGPKTFYLVNIFRPVTSGKCKWTYRVTNWRQGAGLNLNIYNDKKALLRNQRHHRIFQTYIKIYSSDQKTHDWYLNGFSCKWYEDWSLF